MAKLALCRHNKGIKKKQQLRRIRWGVRGYRIQFDGEKSGEGGGVPDGVCAEQFIYSNKAIYSDGVIHGSDAAAQSCEEHLWSFILSRRCQSPPPLQPPSVRPVIPPNKLRSIPDACVGKINGLQIMINL